MNAVVATLTTTAVIIVENPKIATIANVLRNIALIPCPVRLWALHAGLPPVAWEPPVTVVLRALDLILAVLIPVLGTSVTVILGAGSGPIDVIK